jgi:hypothetical protein
LYFFVTVKCRRRKVICARWLCRVLSALGRASLYGRRRKIQSERKHFLLFVDFPIGQLPACTEKVLRELHKRKYAGEEIWLQTLAKDADVSEDDVKFALNDQGLGDWFSIKDGFGLITVKDQPLLKQKLLTHRVEPDSLQPMQARFRGGEFRNVRQFRNCKRNEIGLL